jgi:hypothetical protein
MITLRISNKAAYTFLVISLVLILIGGVYAFGTSNPSTFGHSAGEVQISINGEAKTLQTAIDNGDFKKKISALDCEWTEWSSWATQGNWAEASCESGKSLEGWDCEWSSNSQQHPQITKTLNDISCRYVTSGTQARARAFCCP